MGSEKQEPKSLYSKKWNMAYVMVIVANLLFAVIFYIISDIYGGN
jgi:hypothetical protein